MQLKFLRDFLDWEIGVIESMGLLYSRKISKEMKIAYFGL